MRRRYVVITASRLRAMAAFLATALLGGCDAQPQVDANTLRIAPDMIVPQGVVLAPGQNLAARESRERLAAAPDYRSFANGVLARPVFQTATPDGVYQVEVWSILAAADTETGPITLPGAAVVTLRSGAATLSADDAKLEMSIGATQTLDAGRTVRFSTLGNQRPASFDVVIVRKN